MTQGSDICGLSREEMTQPEDISKLVKTIIEFPNTASVAEITANAECGMLF